MQQRIGEYTLIQSLGSGTFGDVYLARQHGEKQLVAVKVLKTRLTGETLKDFLTEARMVRWNHPHILRVLDFDLEEEKPFLVMEYAPNGTLSWHHSPGQKLPLTLVCTYVYQIADALQYAHNRRIVHRDVKPQNLLFNAHNQVLLSDFGMAVMAHADQSLGTKNMAGTVPYMAPEQIRGKPVPASDQFALGIIVYEWLCGTRPFRGSYWDIVNQHLKDPIPPLQEQLPNLAPAVNDVVMRALAKNPQDRFPSVEDFANALAQASGVTLSPPYVFVEHAQSSAPSLPARPTPAIEHPPQPPVQPGIILPRKYPLLGQLSFSTMKALVEEQPRLPSSNTRALQASEEQHQVTYDTTPRSSQAKSSPLFQPHARDLKTDPPLGQVRQSARDISLTRNILLVGFALLIVGTILFSVPWLQKNRQTVTSHPYPLAHGQSALQVTATAAARAYAQAVVHHGMMPGFDAENTNNNPYEGLLGATTLSQVQTLWSYPLVPDDAGPIVANGLVYISARDGKLYVFDAQCQQQCQPLWTYGIGQSISPVAIGDGSVYVGSVNPFARGSILYAFDAQCRVACQPLWSYGIQGSIASPVMANGLVYVSSSQPGDNSTIQVFDEHCRAACQPLWNYQIKGQPDTQGSPQGPPPQGPPQQSPAQGAPPQNSPPLQGPPPPQISSVAVTDDVLYVNTMHMHGNATIGGIYAFDAHCRTTCQPSWSYLPPLNPAMQGGTFSQGPPPPQLMNSVATPTVAQGLVYVSLAQSSQDTTNDTLYAFNAACRTQCQPLWSLEGMREVAVANGQIYAGSEKNDTLSKFSGACFSHCKPLCSYLPAGPATAGDADTMTSGLLLPKVAHGLVYINLLNSSGNSNLYVFAPDCRVSTRPLWTYGTSGEVTSAPIIINGRIYLGVNNSIEVLGLKL